MHSLKSKILFLLNDKSILITILFCSALTLLLLQQIQPAIALVVVAFIIIVHGEGGYLFLIIAALLSTNSDMNPLLRTAIQVAAFAGISFLFFKHRGFNFKDYPAIPKMLSIYLFALAIVISASTLFSSYPMDGIEQMIRLILFFILAYLIYGLINSEKNIWLFLYAILLSAFVFCIYLIYELYKVDFNLILANTYDVVEQRDGYLHKNYLGSIISVAILIVLGYLFVRKKLSEKILITCFLVLLFTGLIFSNSRSSLVAAVAAIIFFIANVNFKLALKISAGFFLLFILILLSPYSELLSLYLRLENLGTGRGYLLESALSVISENPVFGAGPGGTRYEMFNHIPYLINSPEGLFLTRVINMQESGQAHNFYLFFFSDLGIFGFILAILLPVVFLKMAYRVLNYFKDKSREIYFLILSITGAGVSLFVRGLFEPTNLITYGSIKADLAFWIFFSIISFYYLKIEKELKLAETSNNKLSANRL